MTYRNQTIVDYIDKVSQEILDEKKNNKHRDWFFPKLINKLDLQVGIEVGVDKGGYSQWLLHRSTLKKLWGVDVWMDDFGSDHKPDEYDPSGDARYATACEALEEYIVSGRSELIRSTSLEATQYFADEDLDFAYLDGDHSLEGIYTDIYAWTPKVKVGGIIAGHDYKDGPGSGIQDAFGKQLPYRVKTVVDDFCAKYGFKLNTVGGRIISWYFVKC